MLARMSIGKRIYTGFGVVLGLLTLVGGYAIYGIGGMTSNVDTMVEGEGLRSEVKQKEVDHLNWAGEVTSLLTDDNVTKLNVQTDPHKCGFGKWYYGEGRRRAEAFIPALKGPLADIEQPHAKLHASAIKIDKVFRKADATLPGVLAAREIDHLNWADQIQEAFLENLPAVEAESDPHKCGLGKWLQSEQARKAAAADPEFARLLNQLQEPHDKLHHSVIAIQKKWKQRHKGLRTTLKDRLDDHRQWMAQVCRALVTGAKTLDVETDPTRCAFGKFLLSDECKAWCKDFPELAQALDSCKKPHQKLHASAAKIAKALAAGKPDEAKKTYTDETIPALDAVAKNFATAIAAEDKVIDAQEQCRHLFESETLPALAATRQAIHKCRQSAEASLEGMKQANTIYATETLGHLRQVQTLLSKINKIAEEKTTEAVQEARSGAASTRMVVIIVSSIAGIFGLALAFIIGRAIVRALTSIIEGLNDGAEQVNDAAGQVSTASQQLAEGASEQASSLEETSSALEEMAAMARQNAENANQANTFMSEASSIIGEADSAMKETSEAMGQIADASERVSKIIKVIEEIAFQTNLLALNAAVEAARAGEHGKGFAVVADEVRNLAQRAADAARETNTLIEETVSRVGRGVELNQNTMEAFTKVGESAGKVGELVAQISQASQEQAQGVDQVNTAVAQMDKVTQSNAAGAEESASASEELSAQAENVRGMVDDLLVLVGGKATSTKTSSQSATSQPAKRQMAFHHAGAATSDSAQADDDQPSWTEAQNGSWQKGAPADDSLNDF